MKPDLHLFEKDLKNKSLVGSNAPPRTIRAKDLDGNNKKLTLLKGAGDPPLYELKYTKDGTVITRIFADGANTGDLLYWDGSAWVVLAAPNETAMRVLTISSGSLSWTSTEDCG